MIAHDLPRLIERMHRRLLDVIRIELGRHGVRDISPVQVLMLSNIGSEELSVRDLIERGYYLGSNASYNLKNLVEGGYLQRDTAPRDKRAARLRLTDRGRAVCERLQQLEADLMAPLLHGTDQQDAATVGRWLRRLEQRCSDLLRHSPGSDDA